MNYPITLRKCPNPFRSFRYEWSPVGTPCWIWRFGLDTHGYAKATVDRVTYLVHRENYRRLRGPLPKGLVCDHLCRRRECVNPWHIEFVSDSENLRRGNIKFTLEVVREMRSLYKGGASIKGLARRFKTAPRHARQIVKYQRNPKGYVLWLDPDDPDCPSE